jgi:iron complex outermembrane receptor protein
MLKKLLLISFFAASAFHVTAQAVDSTDDDRDVTDTTVPKITVKAHDLQPVEVRSLRASSNAPFAKTEISALDIAKDNLGQDLPVLLQFTPSSTTTSDAGTGIGYTGLHIRGTDPTRINVTFNGIPVNDPEEQAVYFVDIPDIASSTSSIQIQRGVGTSTNGAGAFGGTISISNLQQFDTAGVILSSSYGSFNTYKNTLVAGTGLLSGGWQFDVRLSQIHSDGYVDRATTDLKSLQFTAGWQATKQTSFHLLIMSGTEKTGQAWDGLLQDSLGTNRRFNMLGQESNGSFYNNQTDNYLQNYYQLFGDHSFGQYLTGHIGLFLTRGLGYYEEYVNGDLLSNYGINSTTNPGPTDLIRRLYLDNYYYGSVFSLLYSKNKTKLTFGGGWTQFENQHYGTLVWEQYGGVTPNYKWYDDPSQKNDLNVYLKAEQNVGKKVILFGDVQYRNVAYYINGFQDNPILSPAVNYNFFNPKAGITYLLTNTGEMKQKLYASGAVANREPNHDDFEASPGNLPKPETLYDVEAGYEINKRKWSFSANLYYMYYHDQLVLTGQINDVGAYTETNVPVSYRAGLELQGAVVVTSWLKLGGNATLSQNKINNYTEYLANYDNNGNYLGQLAINHGTTDIGYSPNVIGAASAVITPFQHMRHGQGFEVDINEKYVGQQFLDNTSNNGRVINAYSFCNVILRYSAKVHPFKEVVASLALNNVFNQWYENNGFTYPYATNGTAATQNYYFPQAGFNVLGGLTFKF